MAGGKQYCRSLLPGTWIDTAFVKSNLGTLWNWKSINSTSILLLRLQPLEIKVLIGKGRAQDVFSQECLLKHYLYKKNPTKPPKQKNTHWNLSEWPSLGYRKEFGCISSMKNNATIKKKKKISSLAASESPRRLLRISRWLGPITSF